MISLVVVPSTVGAGFHCCAQLGVEAMRDNLGGSAGGAETSSRLDMVVSEGIVWRACGGWRKKIYPYWSVGTAGRRMWQMSLVVQSAGSSVCARSTS